ncbi:MAG TPA: glycosyltransferase family 39 protein [Solirubrobacterales bacterium]|nr:glycosyltransferase family 39 protein [Solirubrobacterales bacterium]
MASASFGTGAGRERAAMLGLLALAALGCALGLVAKPTAGPHSGAGQMLDLVRVLSTVALAISLLLGPGIVLRATIGRLRGAGLAFLPLPGLALLVLAGGLAWALAGEVDPATTSLALLAPALGLLLAGLLAAGSEEMLDREERRALLVAGCVLGLAVGRALWSLGPEGELYGGTISRTLEVGDRSDSRISFHIVQLIANGTAPYSELGGSYFNPYNFSSRGPLPGLASAPVVLLAGGRPPTSLPEAPWQPFDASGFMAYRLAMMAFACTAFVSLWDLTRRLAGPGAARLALLLAATTPFLVHEVWFTWPKMLAASFVLLAAICLLERRALLAGALVGLGYLAHPVALLSVPALALLALWPQARPDWRHPRVRQLLLLGVGMAAFLLAWRLINGDHYSQSGFVEYFQQAGGDFDPPLWPWIEFRLRSIANTLVPLLLPLASADNAAINVAGGTSPGAIHFFFQYWNAAPFGAAIVFFPLLLVGLWRAGRLWPWPVLTTVVLPFLVFAVYWGSSLTGMLREGLQTWVLTLFVVLGCWQARTGYGWLRSRPIRAILALRAVEVLAMATCRPWLPQAPC